ncbi:MAG: hypothetical protein P4L59_09455 [Desulfosporosinus sp.]|nr:hypothetical protein [Desulfosporosinus sp.]
MAADYKIKSPIYIHSNKRKFKTFLQIGELNEEAEAWMAEYHSLDDLLSGGVIKITLLNIALLSPGRPEEFHHQSPTEPCVK